MKEIAIVAYSGISLFHLAVPIAIFNDALAQQAPLFNVKVCAEHPGTITSANGLPINITESNAAIKQADIIIFPSWRPEITPSEEMVKLLQQAHQNGKLIVGLCLGAYALAYAGLLDNKQATSHWKYDSDFINRFPKVKFDSNPLFIETDNIITSAGSAAAIDCCLYMVKRFYGVKIANQVARIMVSAPERSGGQNQYIEQPLLTRASDERLAKLTDHILADLSQSYSLGQVANFCSMSVRSFSRHFKQINGISFITWLANMRLNHSLALLESTNLAITKISELAGFSSEQNFRKHFKQKFDTSPNAWRSLFKSAHE